MHQAPLGNADLRPQAVHCVHGRGQGAASKQPLDTAVDSQPKVKVGVAVVDDYVDRAVAWEVLNSHMKVGACYQGLCH